MAGNMNGTLVMRTLVTTEFINDFIEDMNRFRDEGPAYPYVIISEFAKITFMEQRGADND
ncbi:phenolic acid decarboxylase [Pseudomonas sp. NBRC 111123]|uniref:phenolic acid decarboxylase n=1 Tax=Pseudomonas sp. NBRC 111123 TaxID=1661038 RepID=UPI0035294FF1